MIWQFMMVGGVAIMFLVTPEQAYIITVIGVTGHLRATQAGRLISQISGGTSPSYTSRVIRQLQYMQKIRVLEEERSNNYL